MCGHFLDRYLVYGFGLQASELGTELARVHGSVGNEVAGEHLDVEALSSCQSGGVIFVLRMDVQEFDIVCHYWYVLFLFYR